MGAYIINHDEFESVRTHWIALYVNDNKEGHLRMQYILIALEVNIF